MSEENEESERGERGERGARSASHRVSAANLDHVRREACLNPEAEYVLGVDTERRQQCRPAVPEAGREDCPTDSRHELRGLTDAELRHPALQQQSPSAAVASYSREPP